MILLCWWSKYFIFLISILILYELFPIFIYANKGPGHDEISFNVIKSCFGSLNKPLLNIFRLSLEDRIFPDNLKAAKVAPVFKAGDENDFGNYQPISVLSCISKKSCIKDFSIIYKITFYFFKNSLVFSKVTYRNIL